MNKIKLNVLGLSYSQTQSGAYALILTEEDTKRRIPIIIGGFEAQAIAIELEGLKPPRPLTHDLFINLSDTYKIKLVEVNINKLDEGIFYSDLIFEKDGKVTTIDARTSDAIALALRFRCPIYTTEDILSKAGIEIDMDKEYKPSKENELFNDSKESTFTSNEYEGLALDELNKMLSKAIKDENYERASNIRDEINKRKK